MEATSVSHMRKRSIFALSGGEKQRVWISVALAQKPEMLFWMNRQLIWISSIKLKLWNWCKS